jgi:hypothetical protein
MDDKGFNRLVLWNIFFHESNAQICKLKILLYQFLFLSFAACNKKEKRAKPVFHQPISAVTHLVNYDSCKKDILLTKQKNKPGWNKLSRLQKEMIFVDAVAKTIIPGWIGTPWDFNGISETPQKGNIACGYFVTTVLRDAGLNLARVKLAQCASEQMIITLVQPKYIKRFSHLPMADFIAAIQQQGYGLYIVGLDNHTGFIYNDDREIYFIHSTFVGTRNVQQEKAAASRVLQQSKYKVLGKISADEKVLERWME